MIKQHRPFETARWIWAKDGGNPLDRWVLFKKALPKGLALGSELSQGAGQWSWTLRVAAEGHYQLWVNGSCLGEGPSRAWPDELFWDSYELGEFGPDSPGVEIRLLVRHSVPGTTNCMVGQAGCALELVRHLSGHEEVLAVSDGTWDCADHPAYSDPTVKMSNGLGYGEVVRSDLATVAAAWLWSPAVDCGPALSEARRIGPRAIPALSELIVPPAGLSCQRLVLPLGFVRSVNLRPLVYPDDLDVNKHKRFSGILETEILCPGGGAGEVGITFDPHDTQPLTFFVGNTRYRHENGKRFSLNLQSGRTRIKVLVRGEYHDPVFHFHFVLPEGASLASPLSGVPGTPFTFRGPFTRTSHLQVSEPIPPASEEVPSEEALLAASNGAEGEARPLPPYCVSSHHVALESLSARPIDRGDEECYRQGPLERVAFPYRIAWEDGTCRQLIWDFGREVSGFLEFSVLAERGTRLDCFCFESMHDGILEHAYSLNNSLRYLCGGGEDHYRSFMRRGFRYVMMTLCGPASEAVLTSLSLRERLYPTEARGHFACSDPLLNKIWQISARTVSLCMEDTYVDCPAYEQTYWTGDARNSALYSYYLYGAYPLFLRGARLAARSLERSPLFESTVPSSWQNVIPSWSFFHVIAGSEYRFLSGDRDGFRELYPSLLRNMENAAARRIAVGDGHRLFAMYAWNMLDWAPMDVRDDGIIAHQNAQFVIACVTLAKAARAEGWETDARRLETWAEETKAAVRSLFWSEEQGAFRDSLARDGHASSTFSIQTQVFMCLSDIAEGVVLNRLRQLILDPPASFVKIASPFVRHFLYELLLRWGRGDLIIQETKDIWGYMLEKGASTCWEGWVLIPGHYTRSHCHAWSAAPAFFLPTIVLGVYPEGEGFARVSIRPQPGSLASAAGSMPTPLGLLSISWSSRKGIFDVLVEKPVDMEVEVSVPEGYLRGTISVVTKSTV